MKKYYILFLILICLPVCQITGRIYGGANYSVEHIDNALFGSYVSHKKVTFSNQADLIYEMNVRPKKALKRLKKEYQLSPNSKQGKCAAYELAHYYLLGDFDRHLLEPCTFGFKFEGETVFDYSKAKVIDEKEGVGWLQVADPWLSAMIFANSKSRYFNPYKALALMVEEPITEESDSILSRFLTENSSMNIDLKELARNCYRKYYTKRPVEKKKDKFQLWHDFTKMDAVARLRNLMPPTHTSAVYNLKNRTATEFFMVGLAMANKRETEDLALFYLRTAVLDGSVDAALKTYEMYREINMRWGFSDYRVSYWKACQCRAVWYLIQNDIEFQKRHREEHAGVQNYYKNLFDKWRDDDIAKIEARKQRRRQKWNNIFNAIVSATGASVQAMRNNGIAYNFSNIKQSNYLLRPEYAIMQVHYRNVNEGLLTQHMYEQAAKVVENQIKQINNSFSNQYSSSCQYMPNFDWNSIDWNQMSVQSFTETSHSSATFIVDKATAGSHVCSYCKGVGRVPIETNPSMMGTSDYRTKCGECGLVFMKSTGHSHMTCPVCHGKSK